MAERKSSETAGATAPLIVIVTGPTCSGKTTLARALAECFNLPLFHKDGFKEAMFDIALTATEQIDRAFSQLLGRFSLGCLEVALQQCARSGTPAVFEANFDSELFSPRLSALRERYPIQMIQIHLRCRGTGQTEAEHEAALLSRFAARERADRHPGHGAWRKELRAGKEGLPEGFGKTLLRLHREDKPLVGEAGDDLVELDTADFASIDFEPVYRLIERRLRPSDQ